MIKSDQDDNELLCNENSPVQSDDSTDISDEIIVDLKEFLEQGIFRKEVEKPQIDDHQQKQQQASIFPMTG